MRIAQTEVKTQVPNREDLDWRGFHSDWPHDLTDRDLAGRVARALPECDHAAIGAVDAVAVWPGDGRGRGWCRAVTATRSTRGCTRRPKGWKRRIDQFKPIRGEIQVVGPEGSALVMDSRIWHSTAANPSPEPRVGDHHALLSVVVERGIWRAQQCDCAEGGVRGPCRRRSSRSIGIGPRGRENPFRG